MEPKKKIIIISIISGLIILILVIFVIYPLFKRIKGNSEELVATRRNLVLFQSKTGSLEQIKKTYEELESSFKKIEGFFVDPEIPIDFIKFLEKTARESKILIDISPVSPKTSEDEPWKSIGFQLTLTGPSPKFLKFLDKIETGPYLIGIQNLTVKKLVERDFKSIKYEKFSPGDIRANLLTKVFTNETNENENE